MSLTRRNVPNSAEPAARERSASTIWEDEANEYWNKMEPTKRCRKLTGYLGTLVVMLLLCGGVFVGARTALDNLDEVNIAALKARFSPLFAVVTQENATSAVSIDEGSQPSVAGAAATPKAATTAAELERDTTAVDLLRSRCRVRGVQTRWHEETCRKLCMRDPHNSACMNGCSYGSLTVTKLVCDELKVADIPTASRCPDTMSCSEACNAYDNERPFPEMRNSCTRGCSNIVPSACARSLQIYRELLKGTLK
ncbi:hypothetical protein BBJ28_00019221 [Nothophytophthora sp. Chile5]|nr:hypothetical protein BBJ28_00019221 [Nothophytophthora sp. Chile5]